MRKVLICLAGAALSAAGTARPAAGASASATQITATVGFQGPSCSIRPAGRSSCATTVSLLSGLVPYLAECFTLEAAGSAERAGPCKVDDGTGQPLGHAGTIQAFVDSPGCASFVLSRDPAMPSLLVFSDPLGQWLIEDVRIEAVGYAHVSNRDRWDLVPGDPATGTGSRLVLVRGSDTSIMYLRGEILSTSDCAFGVPAANFSLQARGIAAGA